MKLRSLSLLPALVALCCGVFPAAAAVQLIPLSPGKNLVGLHVVEPFLATGTVLSITPLTSGLLAVKLTPAAAALHAGVQWSFETVEQSVPVHRPAMWSRVITWDAGGGQIVVRDPGAACRPAVGQPWKLRPVRTVSTLFAPLHAGDAATADLVHIPNGTGYTTLYRRDGFLAGWRAVGEVGDKSDFPIFLIQGIIIERRGAAPLALAVPGEAMPSAVTISLSDPLVNANGYAHLSTIFGGIDLPPLAPAKTLAASGLSIANPPCSTTVRAGVSLAAADNVLFTLPTPATPFFTSERFFFDGVTWFDATFLPANARPLPSALLIHRKLAGSYTIRLVP